MGRVRKPSAKLQFLEASSAAWDAKQRELTNGLSPLMICRAAQIRRNAVMSLETMNLWTVIYFGDLRAK